MSIWYFPSTNFASSIKLFQHCLSSWLIETYLEFVLRSSSVSQKFLTNWCSVLFLVVISKQFMDNLEFVLLVSFLFVMFPKSDHPNAVLIAYGSFGSPFLTFDCMNAFGAFAPISIVISKALLLCILIPFRCSNWLILSFSKIDCTGILLFLVMLMLKCAIHFPLSHLEFSKRPLPLWLLLLHLLHC